MREPLRYFLFGDRESLPARDTMATQIDAELHDHLESIAERLRHQGLTPDAAQTQAQQIFGPVEPIRRSCLWIQQGDLIMYRALTIIGIGIVALGLIGLMFVGLQIQESIATSTAQFHTMMTELRTSSAPQTPVRDRGTIAGRVYLGTPDRPAAAADLQLVRIEDSQTVRRCLSDASGHFQFDNVQLGDYSVLARLIEKGNVPLMDGLMDGSDARYCIQSAPQILSATAPDSQIALDVQLPLVDMRLELESSMPELIEVGNRKVYLQTYVALINPELVRIPWTPATSKAATAWPVVGWDERNDSALIVGEFGLIYREHGDLESIGSGILLVGKNRETRKKYHNWPPQTIHQVFLAGTYRVAAVTIAYLFSEDDLASQLAFGRGGVTTASRSADTFEKFVAAQPAVAHLHSNGRTAVAFLGSNDPFKGSNGWCWLTEVLGGRVSNTNRAAVHFHLNTLPLTDFTADPSTRVTIGVTPPAEWIEGIREALAKPDITADEMGKALELQRCQCTARAEPIQ